MAGGIPGLQGWLDKLLERRAETAAPEPELVVTTDADGLRVERRGGGGASMRWREVETIAIEARHSGPGETDLWWILESGERRCGFPLGATGYREAAKALPEHFAGFNHRALIDALSSTAEGRFVCWRRTRTASSGRE